MTATNYRATAVVSVLDEYLGTIKQAQREWEEEQVDYYPNNLWFRGQADDWSLLPKVMRPVSDKFIEAGRQHNELKILESFMALYGNYVSETLPPYSIELLAFMQHHGVPTRLLDWTESALMGLYFAVANPEALGEKTPIVWIMAPGKLNHLSWGEEKDFGGPFLASLSFVQARVRMIGFLPNGELSPRFFEKYPEYRNLGSKLVDPIAFYPVSSRNSRLATQKGCFTMQGVKTIPIEELFRNTKCERYLRKISVSPLSARGIREELRVMGITPRSVFPDLHGLSEELNGREYTVPSAGRSLA